jgi:hypothetical protein
VLGKDNLQRVDHARLPMPNPLELDVTHFRLGGYLGIGGFGLVREAWRIHAEEGSEEVYAIKSISKAELLRRHSGMTSAQQELQTLIYLRYPAPS